MHFVPSFRLQLSEFEHKTKSKRSSRQYLSFIYSLTFIFKNHFRRNYCILRSREVLHVFVFVGKQTRAVFISLIFVYRLIYSDAVLSRLGAR
jgi:hypothetical protein